MTHVIAFPGIMHLRIEVVTSESSKLKENKKKKLNAFEKQHGWRTTCHFCGKKAHVKAKCEVMSEYRSSEELMF